MNRLYRSIGVLFFLFLSVGLVLGQNSPGLPTQNSRGLWILDYGQFPKSLELPHDTLHSAGRAGEVVTMDSTLWVHVQMTDGSLRWIANKPTRLGGGDTTIINNYISTYVNSYVDSVFNITRYGDTTINNYINNYVDSIITIHYGDTIINQVINNYVDSVFNITQFGDTSINNYITYHVDSIITTNQTATLQSVMGLNSDLSKPNRINNKAYRLSIFSFLQQCENQSVVQTSVGVLVAPKSNSMIVAPKLGVKLLRDGTTITATTPQTLFRQWHDNGYDVMLTINYHNPNGVAGPSDFATAAQLPQLATTLTAFMQNSVAGYTNKIVWENEENNLVYRPNGNAKDYIGELRTAIPIVHSFGASITNGGLTGPYFRHWLWQWLVNQGRQSDADTLAKYYFTTAQIPNLANWSTLSQFQRGTKMMDSLINAYDTLNIDWVNYHWYEPIQDTTMQTVNTDCFGWAAEALAAVTGKIVISNETGQHNHSALLPGLLMRKAMEKQMPYFIWYSGDASDGTGAVALQDTSTVLRSNGIAFTSDLKTVTDSLASLSDTSNVETFAVDQGNVYLPALRPSRKSLAMIDTNGAITVDTTGVSSLLTGNNVATNSIPYFDGSSFATSILQVSASGNLLVSGFPTSTSQYGELNIGSYPFDGVTSGFFNGSGGGTYLAFNANSGFGGRFIEAQVAGSSRFFVDNTGLGQFANKLGIGSSIGPSATLHLMATTYSTAAAFSQNGLGLRVDPATYTSGSSGTIALTGTNTFSIPTLASSGTATLTTATNVYIAGPPAAGSNITIDRPVALTVNSGETSLRGLSTGYVAKGVSYTLTANDNVVEVTATGLTMTLPDAATCTGREYVIKLTASGTSTVATTGSQSIDGATTYSLSAQNKYVRIKSATTKWLIIGAN